ncbi:uncharacterized protein LOC133185207 isoform X2 [Saccostrea echinata]|uniref:uncharacterized protein LOC133185207 isoform X2 n=1 Tax=Saccostrea echinata TaxID=191078 RepID=UPI002A8095F0|nr:uncharacterized protein LOC133185207 isoform X2 [Saccostrea echinata]
MDKFGDKSHGLSNVNICADVCLPSPRKRFSPYHSFVNKSEVDALFHPNNQNIKELEKVGDPKSIITCKDPGPLQKTDEAGDRTGWSGVEWDPDLGYCSHSTCSSSHNVEQGTESYQSDCSDVEYDGVVQGAEKMEDVVQQFGKYFQGQYHQVIHHIKSSMQSILSEQQDHLRHIINFASKSYQSSSGDPLTDTSSLPCLMADEHGRELPPPSSTACNLEEMDALPPLDDIEFSDFYWTPDSSYPHNNFTAHSFPDSQEQHNTMSDNQTVEDTKENFLLQILSLTCGVNNLLQKTEFKT